MKKRVLCIGDSLGMPREGVLFEHTWFYRLLTSFPQFEFINQFQRGMTSNFLVGSNRFDFLEYYAPHYVIMQLGIVDCSPRYLPTASILSKVLHSLPTKLSSFFWQLLKRYGKRSTKFSYVLPDKFERNLEDYLNRCCAINVDKVILLKIIKPETNMIAKNPRIVDQVNLYNKIIDQVSSRYSITKSIIPISAELEMREKYFLYDGYHLSVDGNSKIFDLLYGFFESKS